jgi:hypothetical protein
MLQELLCRSRRRKVRLVRANARTTMVPMLVDMMKNSVAGRTTEGN